MEPCEELRNGRPKGLDWRHRRQLVSEHDFPVALHLFPEWLEPFDRSAGDAAPYFGLRSCPSLDAWAMGHRPAVSRQGPGAGPVGGQALEVRVAVGPVGRGLAGPECEMDEAASARVGVGRQLWHAAVAVPSASHLRAAAERTRWPAPPRPGEVLRGSGCAGAGLRAGPGCVSGVSVHYRWDVVSWVSMVNLVIRHD